MANSIRVGLIGDYDRKITAHMAIPKALKIASKTTECKADPVWISTSDLAEDVREQLADLDGVWCVPGSPYSNMTGVLAAIRFAREAHLPFLGTCGGYQQFSIHSALRWKRPDCQRF